MRVQSLDFYSIFKFLVCHIASIVLIILVATHGAEAYPLAKWNVNFGELPSGTFLSTQVTALDLFTFRFDQSSDSGYHQPSFLGPLSGASITKTVDFNFMNGTGQLGFSAKDFTISPNIKIGDYNLWLKYLVKFSNPPAEKIDISIPLGDPAVGNLSWTIDWSGFDSVTGLGKFDINGKVSLTDEAFKVPTIKGLNDFVNVATGKSLNQGDEIREANPIPEPSTLALLGIGLFGIKLVLKEKKSKVKRRHSGQEDIGGQV